jgi:ketosteroid isomerase-like protein
MSEQNDRDEIEALFSRLGKAHADKDAAAIVACHSPDAVMFDLAPPLRSIGVNHSAIQAWLDTWDGPVTVNAIDVGLSIGGDVAFASALTRTRGSQRGKAVDFWLRMTQCVRKRHGSG